jgi:hypothetical protein
MLVCYSVGRYNYVCGVCVCGGGGGGEGSSRGNFFSGVLNHRPFTSNKRSVCGVHVCVRVCCAVQCVLAAALCSALCWCVCSSSYITTFQLSDVGMQQQFALCLVK